MGVDTQSARLLIRHGECGPSDDTGFSAELELAAKLQGVGLEKAAAKHSFEIALLERLTEAGMDIHRIAQPLGLCRRHSRL